MRIFACLCSMFGVALAISNYSTYYPGIKHDGAACEPGDYVFALEVPSLIVCCTKCSLNASCQSIFFSSDLLTCNGCSRTYDNFVELEQTGGNSVYFFESSIVPTTSGIMHLTTEDTATSTPADVPNTALSQISTNSGSTTTLAVDTSLSVRATRDDTYSSERTTSSLETNAPGSTYVTSSSEITNTSTAIYATTNSERVNTMKRTIVSDPPDVKITSETTITSTSTDFTTTSVRSTLDVLTTLGDTSATTSADITTIPDSKTTATLPDVKTTSRSTSIVEDVSSKFSPIDRITTASDPLYDLLETIEWMHGTPPLTSDRESSEWTQFGGHYYLLIDDPHRFGTAMRICKEVGYNFLHERSGPVIIESDNENEFVYNFVKDVLSSHVSLLLGVRYEDGILSSHDGNRIISYSQLHTVVGRLTPGKKCVVLSTNKLWELTECVNEEYIVVCERAGKS